MKQDKISDKFFELHRSCVFGLAAPSGEQAGFVSVFGITRERRGDGRFTLADEVESTDIIELVEKLKGLMTYFRFQPETYSKFGDFIFGDTRDHALGTLLHKYDIRIEHSSLIYLRDKEKPFLTLHSEIKQARRDGEIVINDELLLSRRLKDESLQKAAAIQFGDSPAFESLCYAYFGWRGLVDSRNQGPQQEDVISEYQRY